MDAKLEFVAFRATVHPDPKAPLLASKEHKPALLHQAFMEAPSVTQRGGRWHIGNVTAIEAGVLYFRLGRVRRTQLPQTDQRGNFVDTDFDVAPYTHGIVDCERELVALARNSQLSATAEALGRALGRVLSESRTGAAKNVVFEVLPLKNPADFLMRLRSAYTVEKLWLVNLRPNPFDVEKDFIRPTSKIAQELGADTVRTEWRGSSLDVTTPEIEEIVKSTAATGGDAGASLRDAADSAPNRISLTANLGTFSAVVNWGDVASDGTAVLAKLRELYDRIRRR